MVCLLKIADLFAAGMLELSCDQHELYYHAMHVVKRKAHVVPNLAVQTYRDIISADLRDDLAALGKLQARPRKQAKIEDFHGPNDLFLAGHPIDNSSSEPEMPSGEDTDVPQPLAEEESPVALVANDGDADVVE